MMDQDKSPENDNKKWRGEDLIQLKKLVAAGNDATQIAATLGRSVESVRAAIYRNKLSTRNNKG